MNKLVGIPGWKLGENSFGAGINHLEFIQSMGAIPRIIFPQEEFLPELDMIYLAGGGDLSADLYGDFPRMRNTQADTFKEYFFRERLKPYIDNKIPVFGVCLGMQMLNVYFGGTLNQNLMFHPQSADRWETAHTVYWLQAQKEFEVNSHHHQGVKKG